METGKRIEELSAELKKFNRESNSRVEEQAQKALVSVKEGTEKTNQATEKTLSAARKVTQRVGSDRRKSTSKALAVIGECAKKTVSQAPRMAISAIGFKVFRFDSFLRLFMFLRLLCTISGEFLAD